MIVLPQGIILSEQTSSQALSSISEETLRASLLREMAKYVALTADYHGVNDRQSGINATYNSARSHWRRKVLRPSFMSASRSRLTESSEFDGLAKRMRRRGVFNSAGSTNSPSCKVHLRAFVPRLRAIAQRFRYARYGMPLERQKFLSLDTWITLNSISLSP